MPISPLGMVLILHVTGVLIVLLLIVFGIITIEIIKGAHGTDNKKDN